METTNLLGFSAEGKYVTLQVTDNGNLQLTLTEEGKGVLEEGLESFQNYDDLYYDLLLDVFSNSEFTHLHPEKIGALTACPNIIGYDPHTDDRGFVLEFSTDHADRPWLWWFEGYQVRDIIEDLRDYGSAVLHRAS